MAQAAGIRVREVRLQGKWWIHCCDPLLCFMETEDRPLALLPRVGGFQCYDPSEGSTKRLTSEIAAKIAGDAWIVYRNFPLESLGVSMLLKFAVQGNSAEILTIAGMGLLAGLVAIAIPVATGFVFDRLIPANEHSQLLQMGIFLLLFSLAASMFSFVRGSAALRLQGKVGASLQAAVWDRLLSLPTSFFRQFSSGDLAQRSLGIAHIQESLTNSSLNAILTGVSSIFSFVLLFFYSWRLALVASVLASTAAGVALGCGVLRLRKVRDLVAKQNKLSSLLLQLIGGIAKFRASATEERVLALWAHDFRELKQISREARSVSNALAVFQSMFPLLSLVVIFYAHVRMNETSTAISTGNFLAFLTAFTQCVTAVSALSSTAIAGLSVIPLIELAKPIFSTLPEVTPAKIKPGRLSGAIEISAVNFRYGPGLPLVLSDISLRAEPGEFIGIAGPSGSGKSTLLRLLLGFEKPETGAVRYDGLDVNQTDLQALRHQLGVVLQSSRPIQGTILQNIAGFCPLSLEEAWNAARMAGLDKDIEEMPMGMYTHISDGGSNISGGQRQRLMIARAIAAKPRILMLDEATSALDNRTQSTVNLSLKSCNLTRIVIAHRISTIQHADRIYILDDGAIVQSGTFKQLISQPGIFQELAQRQLA
jgi:ATP-binding cassette subfamily C protein